MEKLSFSQNLSDLYDMQKLLLEQQQDGMKLVGFGDGLSNMDKYDLHFFQDFGDILLNIVQNPDLPNPLNYTNIEHFQRSLNTEVEKTEEKLMQPLDQLVQEINNNDWKMTPDTEQKYFAKVFEQDVQEQMGHDLGNVYTHLIHEQQKGKEWVAYPDIEKVGKDDLCTFDTKEEAQQYVVENSHVAVMYDYNAIERITGALEPLVHAAIDKSFESDADKGPESDKDPDKNNDKDKGKDKGRDEEMEM